MDKQRPVTTRTTTTTRYLSPASSATQSGEVYCGCINLGIVNTRTGVYKLAEVALSSISLCLVLWYGTPVWLLLGPAYPFYLTAVTSSLMGSSIFLVSYLVSRSTFMVAKSTVLETVQNGVSFLLLCSSSAFLLVQTSFFLWPLYLLTPFFQAYPAMMAAGVLGCVGSAVHCFDAIFAFRELKR
ncbi:uncharacterized protein LOC115321272 [Ixodes scapularis]|uniref:uncharacterized protein LOC115321272 n=1 Tax=Ixodes scapularis TaxID=6945 RepID=UPI001161C349|nr:uncharacterized protein LOC115321272 [Ixodes scapularis]